MFVRAAAFLAAFISVRGCDPEIEANAFPEQDTPCALFETSQDRVTFALGISPELGADQTLTVPSEYLDPRSLNRYRQGALDGSVLLYVRDPDFAPYPLSAQPDGLKQKIRPFHRLLVQHPFTMEALLTAYSVTPDAPIRTDSNMPNLHAYAGIARRDIFVPAAANTEIFFLCDPATCHMQFNESGLGIDLSLDRALLPEWQRLSGSARQFATCLVNPPSID